MRWVPAALLVALALAGCADKLAGDPASAAGETGGPTGLGAIVGIVVDDAIRPLAEANVSASGPSGMFTAVTDDKGGFRLEGLAAGVYVVEVTKTFYIAHLQAITVVEGVEPETARFQLTFEASQVPYAVVYKYDGFYECGMYAVRLCSNVNIATWIVVCANTGVCLGNVTNDHSLLFQSVEPGLSFLQTEMAWEPTSATGEVMSLLIGGGTEEELKAGVGLPAYNGTYGPSPLMLRITNHEGEGNWCRRNADCEIPDTLNKSRIGTERALLVQVDTGPTFAVAESCGVPTLEPCGAGFAVQQPYSLFTMAFYGYEPPVDWLFATTGELPPPPA
ncbi:MAG: carboxypeptidase-like regulatory domain-containing protein [Thermoplasmatota archaeon]